MFPIVGPIVGELLLPYTIRVLAIRQIGHSDYRVCTAIELHENGSCGAASYIYGGSNDLDRLRNACPLPD